ncbi:hypothetical protein AALP_AA4G261000 [Arabis alpina]|uniref:RING-type E3 ubiquitin transferase n=1 Tax=Arabis alpina TaxID=50452 RepID=A0A087H5R8_ARAAL|nr:hypothetical protein AALP_AA4G261000 [Arabis alpina]
MEESCAVCAENLEWVAYGSCGHREVCSTCVVRLRFIFGDRRCCICKTECPLVFVTKALGDETKTISDFTSFPLVVKEGSVWYHEETKVIFDDLNQYTRVKEMCRLSCTLCDKTKKSQGSKHRLRFKSVEHLKEHLNHQHKLHMCGLCLVGRKVFICEQKLFTKEQLNQHVSSGDSEVDGSESERGGFTGHPMCEFCKSPFYGGNELYNHMSREHYTCHICQRLKPGQYEYYGNYDDLEIHFRSDHFLCEDESCLAKKFVVFQIEDELKRHNSIDHGGRMSRSQQNAALQIQAGFQYQNSRRRRGRLSRRETNTAFLESQASNAINDGYPLLQPMRSSGGSRLGESSFPPLSVQANRGQARVRQNSESLRSNSMAAHLRHQTNRSGSAGSSQALPALNRAPTQGSITSSASAQFQSRHHGRVETTRTLPSAVPQDVRNELTAVSGGSSGSSMNSGNAKRNHYSSSNPKMSETRSLEQPSHSGSTPVSAVKNRKASSSASAKPLNIQETQGVSDVQSANMSSVEKSAKALNIQEPQGISDVQSVNKSLVEKIRTSLGDNEELFKAFKDTSGKYRHGSIDAKTYLEHVKGYGLSHLVLDMARLCPDPKRQKDLFDTHNACSRKGNDTVQSSSEAKESCGLKKNKGKAVKVESSSDSVGVKLQSSEKSHDEDKDAYRSDKGKTKVTTLVDSSSTGVGLSNTGKQCKKTSKFHRARLGEKSMAAVLDLKKSNLEPEPESKKDNSKSTQNSTTTSAMPLRGAWRKGTAVLFS